MYAPIRTALIAGLIRHLSHLNFQKQTGCIVKIFCLYTCQLIVFQKTLVYILVVFRINTSYISLPLLVFANFLMFGEKLFRFFHFSILWIIVNKISLLSYALIFIKLPAECYNLNAAIYYVFFCSVIILRYINYVFVNTDLNFFFGCDGLLLTEIAVNLEAFCWFIVSIFWFWVDTVVLVNCCVVLLLKHDLGYRL